MNIHNHSIWPPPGVCYLNHPAPTARNGALLQQSVCAALILAVIPLMDDTASPVTNRSDKE